MKKQWRENGYFMYHDFFPEDFLNQILEEIKNLSTKNNYDFGSINGCLEFPIESKVLNLVTLYPKLIKCCQELLNTSNIRLIQSDIWSKHNDGNQPLDSNQDQRIHMDYPNNYLTHPDIWENPESVAIIIYYSDSQKCEGFTKLVPKNIQTEHLYQYPYKNIIGLKKNERWANDKNIVEDYYLKNNKEIYQFRKELYNFEISPVFRPGSVLFYRHDLWHRGSPIKFGENRIVHNIGFKKAHCDWITTWNHGWARTLCSSSNMENLLGSLDNEQRKCLGFPDKLEYYNDHMKEILNYRYGISKL